MLQAILDKVLAEERINGEEFLQLHAEADLYQLGFLADSIRKRLHPEPVVTYVIDRNINYTDICISACKFCAFFKAPEEPGGLLLSKEELEQSARSFRQRAKMLDIPGHGRRHYVEVNGRLCFIGMAEAPGGGEAAESARGDDHGW